jgi:hypothetical protein
MRSSLGKYINAEPKNESEKLLSCKEFRLFLIIYKKQYLEKEKVARKDFLKHEHGSSFNAKELKSHHNLTCYREIVQKSSHQKYIHKRKTFTINDIS